MEGIRMYKEKQKVGFGMNYTQSRELKENNRIYREMESIYHEICVKREYRTLTLLCCIVS